MTRNTRVPVLSALAFATVALLVACGSSGPERQLLENFFRASRVRDNASLANIAAVSFDARTSGTVQSFDITEMSAEEHRSLRLDELQAEEAKAIQDDADFTRQKRAYQDSNIEAIRRVEAATGPLSGKDAEVQAAWAAWSEDRVAHTKRVSDARAQVRAEIGLAVSSLTPPGRADTDVTGLDLEMVSKQVTVSAEVRDPSGETSTKTLVLTLRRVVGVGADAERMGHWIVMAIQGAEPHAPVS